MRAMLILLVLCAGAIIHSATALACETCGCQGAHGEVKASEHEAAEGSAEAKDKKMAMEWEFDDHALNHGLKLAIYNWEHPVRVAVVKGMLSDGPEQVFKTMWEAAEAQQLVNADTLIGSVMPNAMTMESLDELQYWPGISLAEGAVPAAPLEVYTIMPQRYIMALHEGPYEELEASWMAAMEYLGGHGVEFDTAGPALEHYVNDPATTAPEDLIVELYIPITDDAVLGSSH